ncbi:MAG: DUF2752 domain-containing protein [Myxococcota bacterium]|jgi:hypothetical protein|nr:DUF2752 domain-containing protein [Myxococcota bacterium]
MNTNEALPPEQRRRQRWHRLAWFGALAAIGLGSWLIATHDPRQPGFYPPCVFHAVTGAHCPGCGTLRALHSLFHGRFLDALDYNPLMILSLPFLAWVGLRRSLEIWSLLPPPRPLAPWLGRSILILILLYWLLRNLPWWPLTVLAP